MYNPMLEDFYKAYEENRLTKHETEHFVGFKYNIHTTFNKLWDDVTLNARGIVFDKETGEIVARPFRKFFNFSEMITPEGNHTELYNIVPAGFKPNLGGHFRVMDKLDGFLAIIFYNKYENRWQVKTAGSFEAKQSAWAQEWLDDNIDTGKMIPGFTYLFEGIWHDDRHVVRYNKDELKLLSYIDNKTGDEMPLSDIERTAQELNVGMAEVKNYFDFNEMLSDVKDYPKELEGVVVTFDNGYKCKVKSIRYCEMFRIMNNLTEREVFMRYDPVRDIVCKNVVSNNGYRPLNYEELPIPEELPDIDEYVKKLKARMHIVFNTVLNAAEEIIKLDKSGKELYDEVCCRWKNKPEYVGITMSLIKSLQKGDTVFAAAKIAIKKYLRKQDDIDQ